MMEYDHDPSSSGESYYMDGWDGYVATRNRVFEHLVENRIPNPIVITGDIHAAWVADLKYHPDDPDNSFKRGDSMTLGTEFVGASISSGLSQGWMETYQRALEANPHVRYFDGRSGGYVRCHLNADRCHADFLLAGSLNDRLSPMRTVASFEVYPEADPSLRKGAVLIFREGSELGEGSTLRTFLRSRLAAVVAGALFVIVALITILVLSY